MPTARRTLSRTATCRALAAACCLGLGVTAGCGGAAAATTPSTKAGLQRATWGANVTITYGKGYVRYRSNGIPNHARQAQYALPNAGVRVPDASSATAGTDPTKAQSYDFKITTTPKKAAKTTSTSLGVIGVMTSGAALFNPYEGDAKTVAVQSNFTVPGANGTSVAFLDSCNGHPTPTGTYHYHALPKCITARVDKPKGASHIIGLAFDGYPIYGNRDVKGRVVPAAKLDRCNGITSATPEFPKGIYHYVLPDTTSSRSSIRCFHGTVDPSLTQMSGMPPMGRPAVAATASATTFAMNCPLMAARRSA